VPDDAVVIRCNRWMSQLSAVRAGLGLGALPRFLANPQADLIRVLPPEPATASKLWLLTHPDLQRAARVLALMDTLARNLHRERARIEGRGA
jgi:DNA-binding transcriptional LysR family regulator